MRAAPPGGRGAVIRAQTAGRAPSAPRARPALDALVLDAQMRQALVAVRSLGRAGLRPGAVASSSRTPALRSRWCAAGLARDAFPVDGGASAGAILELLDERPARVLMPLHDGTIEAVRARRAEIEARCAIALAPEAGLAIAVDKTRTLDLAGRLGVAVPHGVAVGDPGGARSAVAHVGLPAVVKPVRSWLAHEGAAARHVARAVASAEQATAAVASITDAGGEALVQEWLPGRREAVSLLVADGAVRVRFAQVAHTMAPSIGGSSVLRTSIPPPPDACRDAERLVREMGLEGYSEVEFRRDRAGRPVLMEVNPRLSASVEVAVRAGVDFPLLVYRWSLGQPLRAPAGYLAGVRMRWLGGEISRLAEAMRRPRGPDVVPLGRGLVAFAADSLRPSGYDYLARDDPAPALQAAASKLAEYGGRAAVRLGIKPREER
jgi:predicted ATP-grasp superfamily ATP-dependent carboligase